MKNRNAEIVRTGKHALETRGGRIYRIRVERKAEDVRKRDVQGTAARGGEVAQPGNELGMSKMREGKDEERRDEEEEREREGERSLLVQTTQREVSFSFTHSHSFLSFLTPFFFTINLSFPIDFPSHFQCNLSPFRSFQVHTEERRTEFLIRIRNLRSTCAFWLRHEQDRDKNTTIWILY